MNNGWGKLPLAQAAITGKYVVPIKAGSPYDPSEIDSLDIQVGRGCLHRSTERVLSQLEINTKGFKELLDLKKIYIRWLPNYCLINKKLLPFIAKFRTYAGNLLLSEQLQNLKKVDQDLVISRFPKIIDNPDIITGLIKHWDPIL